MFELLDALGDSPARIVVSEGDAEEYGYVAFVQGLVTISDLNKRRVRRLVYEYLSELEIELSELVQSSVQPSIWIEALSEDHQVKILGYWEIAKKRGVDVGPMAAATLTNLLTIAGKIPSVRKQLGYESRKAFEREVGHIREYRNRTAHPLRPLVLSRKDTVDLSKVLRAAQNILIQIRQRQRQPAS